MESIHEREVLAKMSWVRCKVLNNEVFRPLNVHELCGEEQCLGSVVLDNVG